VLEIRRISRLIPRYAVRDDRGHGGTWVRRRFKETMTGELDGQPYEFVRDGRRRFFLMQAGVVIATATAGRRGRWAISVAELSYEVRRKSAWRFEMELCAHQTAVGSIRKGPRGKVVCQLPPDLSPAAQAFIGFLVLTLWSRAAAASSGASAGAVAASSA
jgi:hypothetical protein